MELEFFSEEWAKAWEDALNKNLDYQQAVLGWEWPVVLQIDPDEGQASNTALYLNLVKGHGIVVRPATDTDLMQAPYVISAPVEKWHAVLVGELDPIMAILLRGLKLKRGKLLTLARYSAAARQLVESARTVSKDLVASRSASLLNLTGDLVPHIPVSHETFRSVSPQGLRHDILPMRLYHKAKRLGTWNPQDIEFSQDREDWLRLTDLEKRVILHLTSLFLAGEESVTSDILPLMTVIAREGRLEEELFLATFLWEEAKHTEFFRRFLDEVARDASDLSRFHAPAYRRLFYEELPAAMNRLFVDSSLAAQVRAAVTYNIVVEGMLAETGYHAYHRMLERNNLMPGMQEGIARLKRDESRHIAYGVFLISRLVAAHSVLWLEVEKRMEELLSIALQVINEIFDQYDKLPFGLRLDDFVDYSMDQFKKRMGRIEAARELSLQQLHEQEVTDGI